MKRRFVLYRRKRGGRFYVEDTETRKQESTGTRNRAEATALLNARNEPLNVVPCAPMIVKQHAERRGRVIAAPLRFSP
ncbi:MAG: hypothetical protein M9920_03275 [Verrucomicrobiae bacterium]|nr:hypothetical protein [Verrucomicrobiae bacterium]